ncbi:MAG: DUF3343 domain-containing protein [Bacteroidetes bacterium]|nr:DUF3343 domain-containing protein [Bacteroidota bacterium]
MLFLFESTYTVIKAEKIFRDNNIKCRIIPVPRSISPDCGMAIEIYEEFKIQAEIVLNENNVKYSKHY